MPTTTRHTTNVQLTDHTRQVLATATVADGTVRLTCGQLTPDLFAPVKETLEAIGGVWSRKADGYRFPAHIDPAAALADVLEHGRVPMHPRKAEGYVRTPEALADEVVSWWVRDIGSLHDGATVLEPSAGDGALVAAILEYNRYVRVHAVEPDPGRAHALRVLADNHPGRVTVHEMTFETFAASHGGGFHAVVMNPPFTVPGNRVLWAEHVLLAHQLTAVGGHVAAIVPNSFPHPPTHKAAKAHRDAVALVERCGGFYQNLARDAFKASGTDVLAGVVCLPKPLQARPDRRPLWLFDGAGLPTVEPVRVPDFPQTWRTDWPVQVYEDRRNGYHLETVRLAGQCFGCSRPLWAHDSGREHALNWCLSTIDPADGYGMTGPCLMLCMTCYSNGDVWQKAYDTVRPYWTPTAEGPDGPHVYPGDLDTGLHAEVTGVDWRGETHTFAGQVTATPETLDEGVTVKLRGRLGVDIELTVPADQRVVLLDAPADDRAPKRPAPQSPTQDDHSVTPVTAPEPDGEVTVGQLPLFDDRGWASLVNKHLASGAYSR